MNFEFAYFKLQFQMTFDYVINYLFQNFIMLLCLVGERSLLNLINLTVKFKCFS